MLNIPQHQKYSFLCFYNFLFVQWRSEEGMGDGPPENFQKYRIKKEKEKQRKEGKIEEREGNMEKEGKLKERNEKIVEIMCFFCQDPT